MHVIIQAGGKGTRLENLTRNKPKCLVPIENKPMIFWAFETFLGHDLTVICDYKEDVLTKYLEAFGGKYHAKVVKAEGKGTASGIKKAISSITDDDTVLILWCDLFFEKNYIIPDVLKAKLTRNIIGLSSTFPCRWSFKDRKIVEEASSSRGIAGFFAFKNKDEILNVPENGAFVEWLRDQNVSFDPLYLENITEVGTISSFEKKTVIKNCRPFNDVQMNAETVTKKAVDEQGKSIAVLEKQWYREISQTGYKFIPKIYSYDPLIMNRINGKNIWEYDCLTITEKKNILNQIINGLTELHNLLPKKKSSHEDLEKVYIQKTFDRLDKIRKLVPFADKEFIKINQRYYKNIFFDRVALEKAIRKFYPSEFSLIHGDCTFSNILYDRLSQKVYFIDPRGYFGDTHLYGDIDYDWAKVYYSLVGNYDQFNRKKFALDIRNNEIELAIKSNNWSDIEDFFFESIGESNKEKIKILHAIIWLSLTTYAWDDYDSICGAFYNGIIHSADFL